MVEYPKQIFCIWGGNQSSLSATCELQEPKKTGIVAPLELHEGNLSRYVLTLLDTSTGATIPLIANIPARDVSIISKKTDIAMFMKESYAPEGDTNVSLCYTEEIKFGRCKGKTPASALYEDPGIRSDLEKTKKLLMDNVAKYPSNQRQIDAIEEAILLLDTGELNAEPPKANKNKMEIYDRKFKPTRRKNAKGYFLCYNVNITCHFDMDYAWTVTVENYYAPNVDGKIDHKQAENRKKGIIRIKDDEWAVCVCQFEDIKHMFETVWFKDLYKRAIELNQQQIEEARLKKAQ